MSANEAANRRRYLSLSLAGNDCAVGILQVKEILKYDTVTRIPSVPRTRPRAWLLACPGRRLQPVRPARCSRFPRSPRPC